MQALVGSIYLRKLSTFYCISLFRDIVIRKLVKFGKTVIQSDLCCAHST